MFWRTDQLSASICVNLQQLRCLFYFAAEQHFLESRRGPYVIVYVHLLYGDFAPICTYHGILN